jgi:excinuclease ABC subunit C
VRPEDAESVASWLSALRGSVVDLRVPRRGDKKTLMETVHRNAQQSLARHKLARAGDLTARSQALQELQESLDLADAPLRVECYDISHIQGSQVVGSMVVFEDGLPRKSEYRRFVIRGAEVDDTAAMDEVLTRRFQRYLDERDQSSDVELAPDPEAGPDRIDPDTGKPKKFAYPPNLVVVDGGLPQVNAARAALGRLGIDDVAVVGLAKRLEEVWVPGQDYPVILPRTSEGLYLLQRVRDEAHRFAITFHRQRRSKAMTASALDRIPGLGEQRRKALLREFGSVKKIRVATVEELQGVAGIGPALAATIAAELAHEGPAAPAVNLMTGEIIDEDGAGS